MAKQAGGKSRVKFPTGIILWLDGENRLQSEPTEFAEGYRARHPHSPQAPIQPIGIEDLVQKLITGELIL